MKKLKRLAALAAAAATTCMFGACGSSTANALTIDGMQVRAGVYIYYSYMAYNEAINTLSTQNSELDTTDDKLVKKQTINGKDTLSWIQDRAQKYCQEYVAVLHQSEEVGVALTEDEIKEIDTQLESAWEYNGETFQKNGISEESVRDILEYTYLAADLFLYYYDVDGAEGVKEADVKTHYIENNARVRYITFNLTDGNGEALTEDSDIKEIEDMVNDYCDTLKKLTDEEEKLAEFDHIQEEYNAYVTSISNEAAGITETTTTTTTVDATASEATTTEAEAAEDTTETTVADGTADEAAVTTAADSETEDTTVTTAAAEEGGTTETTTTANLHANESIIAKVTTAPTEDDDSGIVTTTTEPTYTPSKAAYDAIFAEDVDYGVPFVVEDEDAYYLIMRMDIEDRMTEDDLWTEDRIEAVISGMYAEDFTDKLDEWTTTQTVDANKRAVKRYNPFDFEFDSQA